jgi:hypothetical protein
VNPETERQQLLFVWTDESSLHGRIIGWNFHDGNDPASDQIDLPYERGVDVLADGWRLLQAAQLTTRPAGDEFQHGVLEFEWIFERIVTRFEPHRRPE